MEEALVARLIAAMGHNDIYWIERPQSSGLPAIVMNNAHTGKEYTHDGRSNLQYDRIQFDSYGKTYLEAKQQSRALSSEMEARHQGDAWIFEEAHEVSGADLPPVRSEAGTRAFKVTMDFMVPYRPNI